MSKTFKLGFLGRFTVMYFVVVLVLCAFSPLFQVQSYGAASTDVVDTEAARAVTGHKDYTVDSTFPSNILGVSAVYYDYLSDQEIDQNGKWLYPQQSGTGHNDSSDDWYPFYSYNKMISDYAKSNSSWDTPLYFGNFCNTSDAYPNGNDHDSWGWDHVTGDEYGYKFNYPANNSNALSNNKASYQGLVHDELINNELYMSGSVKAPYFNNDWLHQNGIAKIIEGEFPFTIETENGYKKYSFNSKNAEDNVYFTWANDGSGSYPTKVNYGAGSSFGVDDGIKYFMFAQNSGKGIFPFNNASDTNKGSKDTNENLNYGFGIRMDIDFRVPKNGLIPGTNTPIKFDFTGDDDLWVYITDKDTGKSQLVLDMGGAHKESHGSINFNTKTSTVDCVYDQGGSSTGTRYVYLSKDNTGWSNDSTYAYFFNGSGDVGNGWPGYKMSTYGDGNNLRVAIPSGATHVIFNNNAGAQTGNIELAGTNGAFWLTNTLGVNQWDTPPADAGLSSVAGGVKENVQSSFDFDNSNDQKTYTMSVFYMERGLIESNMSISFTMTPLTNDLEVTKSINTTGVNPGLVDELTANEEFTYTIYNDSDTNSNTNNHKLATNKAYTHTTNSSTTGSDGKFYLKDKESARFDSQFNVGTGIKVVENATSKSGLSYSTSYELTDKVSGSKITAANSTESKFDYINSQRNIDDKTSLKLAYTNTPKVAPISVTKKVVDENNKDISANTTAEFTYNIALDLYEGNKFNENLSLEYTKYNANGTKVGTDTTSNGTFKLKAGQRAVFNSIPVGTNYKITEEIYDGYLMSKYVINSRTVTSISNNTVSGSVSADQNIEITNMYKPASTSLKAYKTLDGASYSGSDFTFKVSGLASKTISGVKTIETSSKSMTSSNCVNGAVTFSNTTNNQMFTFDKAGTYCYKIEEVAGSNSAYVYDDAVYYAKVVVTSNSGALSVSSPTYYSNANFTTQVSASNVKFENSYANSEVRIVKKNFNGTKVLEGAEFMMCAAKLNSSGEYVVDSGSDFAPRRATVAKFGTEYYAKFEDIPKGEYIVIETKAPVGYELSDEMLHITVERTAQNNGVLEFSMNDTETTKLPNAGGKGSAWILLIAVCCLSISVMFLKHYDSKKKKAYCRYTKR